MGMREWCHHWWTISHENLKSICGAELDAVERCKDFDEDSWYRIASDDCDSSELTQAVRILHEKFRAVTGGLELVLLTYDADMDGTRGAEVDPYDGIIFGVGEVVALTPAGVANQHLLRESTWSDAG